jgi:formate-dependent nitrite reductase membrane component NrfD
VERGTAPNLWYKGAQQANIEPLAASRSNDGGIWRDPGNIEQSWLSVDLTTNTDGERTGVNAAGTIATDDVGAPRVVYANEFPMPWGWRVSSYFLTKAMSAGIAIAAAMALLFGSAMESMWMRLTGPLVGGLLLLLTGLLLVADLKRPDRFYYLLTRGNPSSWLVRGAWILSVQAVGFAVWFLSALAGTDDLARAAIWFSAFVGLGTAGYTAYLFAQAKGRVLWGNPRLVWHMIAAAFTVGGGVSLIASLVSTTGSSSGIGVAEAPLTAASVPTGTFAFALTMVLGALGLGLIAALDGKEPDDPGAALAHHHMTKGVYASRYRTGLVLGIAIPVATGIAVIFGAPVLVGAIGGVSALVGVWLLDDAFVQAGQSVPLT